MRANLKSVMTDEAYAGMIDLAGYLKADLDEVLRSKGLAWSVTQIGSRWSSSKRSIFRWRRSASCGGSDSPADAALRSNIVRSAGEPIETARER